MGRPLATIVAAATIVASLAGCSNDRSSRAGQGDRVPLAELLATDLGGETTRAVVNQNAFGLPAKALPGDLRADFEVGDSFFTQPWVIGPASTTNRDGLGPTFNATACASCHVLDGRAEPPTDEHPDTPGLLLRLSVAGADANGGPAPHPVYGGQLQDRSIPGVPAEGRIGITYEDVPGAFDDGTEFTLRKPIYRIADPAFGDPGPDLRISPRIAPVIVGMGLLEAVPEATVQAAADPSDRDRDGISGRINTVWDENEQRRALGRFGWKANVATVRQQTAGAFSGDLGITSPVLPDADCPAGQAACLGAPNSGNPEIGDSTFDKVVFYTRVLAVPAARDEGDTKVRAGAKVFADAGCASCHTPTLRTGDSDIAALANQTIHPFTDLLLHDLGPGLADDRSDFEASGSEWRTAPLWGIGLVSKINGHTRFLHDGRARSIMEAILWHGGEADNARRNVLASTAEQRETLVAYLESR